MLCLLSRCLSEVLFPLGCMLLDDGVSVVCFAFVGCASALPTKSSSLPPVVPVWGFIFKMLSILIFSHDQNGFVVSAFYIPSSPWLSSAGIHTYTPAPSSVCSGHLCKRPVRWKYAKSLLGSGAPFLWSVRLVFCQWHTFYMTTA